MSTRVFLDANVLFSALYAPRGQTARLFGAAASGRFVSLVSPLVLDEVVRNLHAKVPRAVNYLASFLRSLPLEVAAEAPDVEIAKWRDLGFGTDAPVIAAALGAEVEFFCTGDRRLLRELPGHNPPFHVVAHAALLARVLDPGAG